MSETCHLQSSGRRGSPACQSGKYVYRVPCTGCQGINCGASLWDAQGTASSFLQGLLDGVRIAHSTTGSGPAMIEVATWLNHLEFDWQSPVWRPRLVEMAKNYTMALLPTAEVVACRIGSSKTCRSMPIFAHLEAVADATGFGRFILLGSCQGSGLAIAYAARHPERVSNLVLYGAFARGRLMRNPSARDLEEAEMMLKPC